ncbi:PepSY-associated TM helix domain-containing protein [Polaromonas eurypsychrophila]|uniref:Uncharacterized protein n=1 Tax=Polaromonas eurypsychrophila TaxID=1614635 RepID=A0A916SN57_9BURK|nr:PepSY-associated TM helix domain-containing protein [Polaromonas eurypsychrophila]GGB08442.1 hypothetical protein GCM10011496_31700 [Polaromonas eurypsychrophila]
MASVSGIATHKRILADFYTFRPKNNQSSWLDAHNAVAVLALPYHLMITSPRDRHPDVHVRALGATGGLRGRPANLFAEVFTANARDRQAAGRPPPLAPIAPLVAQASAHWGLVYLRRVRWCSSA